MAYTQQQLADLDAAIAEGALIVQSAGRRVEYRSLDEMLRVRRLMAAEIEATPVVERPRRRYLSFARD